MFFALMSLLVLIALGAPIFLALGFAGMLGLYLARGEIAFILGPTSFFGQLNSFELLALPLFILMGAILVETPIGANMFRAATVWLNWLRGGLAIASVGASTVFGAISGVSIAGVSAVGSLAVPQMLSHGYSRSLAAGAVVTSGALAMLIPPSVPFIIYSAVSGVSVAKLFIGGIVPGLVLAGALSLYIYLRARVRPADAPPHADAVSWAERWRSLAGIWHALVLIAIVLGSIYSGIATPTEAAAVGAIGAFLIAALVYRVITWKRLYVITLQSARISGTILLIMGCAKIFGDYLNFIRVPQNLTEWLLAFDLPSWVILLAAMLLLVLLGMLVDAVSLIVVTTPILLPLITALGYDPLWFGIILVMNLEIAVVTPPVGLNLYALRGACPMLSVEEIIQSSVPFVAVQFAVLLMFVFVPGLALWLPGLF